MIGALQCVVLDCPDPKELAGFYQALVGGEVDRPNQPWTLDEDWSTLHTASGQVLGFQRVAEYQAPSWPDPGKPQQFHLDIAVPDLDRAQAAVAELGATSLDASNEVWRVFADPAGHPFCLVWE